MLLSSLVINVDCVIGFVFAENPFQQILEFGVEFLHIFSSQKQSDWLLKFDCKFEWLVDLV